MLEIGGADQLPAFDRMHDVRSNTRKPDNLLNLGQRGDVEVLHAGIAQRAKHLRRVIGFDGVKAFSGKIFDKPTRGPLCRVRTQDQNRALGALQTDIVCGAAVNFHSMGPPQNC